MEPQVVSQFICKADMPEGELRHSGVLEVFGEISPQLRHSYSSAPNTFLCIGIQLMYSMS